MNLKTSLPPKLLNDNIPAWRRRLHQRGLSDATIAHFQIQPDGHGWKYPVDTRFNAIRWKAFPGQHGAKYRWLPEKPADVRLYDPDGKLKEHIAAAGGQLILVEGEPDVWALWEGGIKHASCLL